MSKETDTFNEKEVSIDYDRYLNMYDGRLDFNKRAESFQASLSDKVWQDSSRKIADQKEILLVIDQSLTIREELVSIFGEKYELIQVESWINALDHCKKEIRLILLEAGPGGKEFLRYIRQYHIFHQIPILVMYESDDAMLGYYYRMGIAHSVHKPFEKDIVYSKVENTLRHQDLVKMERDGYASLDRLTGLARLDYFYQLANSIIKEKQEKEKLIFVYFDVNNFKAFNSEYGYEKGDQLLRELSDIITKTFTKYIVGRTSNDHFIVMTNEKNLKNRIKKIHELTHSLQQNVKMELRAGIYIYEKGVSVEQAHDRAKIACDALKGEFNQNYRYYDEDLRQMMYREKYIIDHIDQAVEQEYLTVYYQPIKGVFSEKICAMESLVRWNDPQLGFLSPIEFIPILEQHHLIHKVDTYVVDRVCKDILASKKLGEKVVPLSVNFSRLDFQIIDVYQMLVDTIKKYGIKPKMIYVEVTESVLNDDEEKLRETLKKIHEAGFEIWLDDFGSEYSTLNTLQNYSFDLLKIDMKFFVNFDSNENARTIIASIVDMAKRLHMRVLAEGIETREQYDFLKRIGGDKAQGYYICRPTPLDSLYGRVADVEEEEEADYFAAVGKVNFLSPNPLEDYKDEEKIYNVIPTAIVQYKKNVFDYLYANQGFVDCLKEMGVKSLSESKIYINPELFMIIHSTAA